MSAVVRPPGTEAEIDLGDLETAAAFLGPAGLFDPKNRATCETFAKKIAAAIDAGARIAIVGRGAKSMSPDERWRVPLADAPRASRLAATAALVAVAAYCGKRPDLDLVTYLL